MLKRSFSVEDKLAILEEAKREGVSATLRKHNIGSTLYYKWRDRFVVYGIEGLKNFRKPEDGEAKRLADENARLKKLLAERDLEIQLKDELLKKKRMQEQNSKTWSSATKG